MRRLFDEAGIVVRDGDQPDLSNVILHVDLRYRRRPILGGNPFHIGPGESEMVLQDQLQQIVIAKSKQEGGRGLIQKRSEFEFQSPFIAQAAAGFEE